MRRSLIWILGLLVCAGVAPVRAQGVSDPMPPASQAGASGEAEGLRPADVEVQITRVLARLQARDLRGAKQEAARIREIDASQRARYLHALACAGLEDWRCAAEDLEVVRRLAPAGRFPGLELELATALEKWADRRSGPLLEVRAARPFALFAALSAGFDGNTAGQPDTGPSACAPLTLPPHQLPRGCGAFLAERAGGWLEHRVGPLRPRLDYQFAHRWHPDRTQALFDLQRHSLRAGLTFQDRIDLAYGLEAAALANRYQPLYQRSHRFTARAAFRPHPGAGLWLLGWHALERWGDLQTLWGLEAEAACDAGPDALDQNLYCSSGRSGTRTGLALETRIRPGRWGLDGGLEAERIDARTSLYDGFQARLRAGGQLRLGRTSTVRGSIAGGYQRLEAWDVVQLQPTLSVLWRPLAPLQLELRYGADWQQATLLEARGQLHRYTRQVALLEVLYAL